MTRKAILRKRGLNKSQGKSKKTNGSKVKTVKKDQVAASSTIINKRIGHCGLEMRGEFCMTVNKGAKPPYDYCPSCLRGESLYMGDTYSF